MKRFFLTFAICLVAMFASNSIYAKQTIVDNNIESNVGATVYWYKAYAFSMARVVYGNYQWGEWTRSNVQIKIDVDNDVITMFSSTQQRYIITGEGNWVSDGEGGKQITWPIIDQDYDKGSLRLRITCNGKSQIIIYFADVAWAYEVRAM